MNKRASKPFLPLFWLLLTVGFLLSSCQSATPKGLVLDVDGEEVTIPVDSMAILLVEDHAFAEQFEIQGPGVYLAGEFPLDIHVGYEENWDALIGQTVALGNQSLNNLEGPTPFLQLPGGSNMRVLGGVLTIETVAETSSGTTGLMITGTVNIQVQSGNDLILYEGIIEVPVETWG